MQRRMYGAGVCNLTRICRSSMNSKTYIREATDQISVFFLLTLSENSVFNDHPVSKKVGILYRYTVLPRSLTRCIMPAHMRKTLHRLWLNSPTVDRAIKRSLQLRPWQHRHFNITEGKHHAFDHLHHITRHCFVHDAKRNCFATEENLRFYDNR